MSSPLGIIAKTRIWAFWTKDVTYIWEVVHIYNMKNVLMSGMQHNECKTGNNMKWIIKKGLWKHEFECWVASQLYPELDCY